MLRAGGPKLTITQVQIDGFEYEKQRVTGTYFNNWLERYESLSCLLYTSDAADERSSVDLGGRRIIKKKKYI